MFDFMGNEEFMFKFEKDDYKFICEYDTIKELIEIQKLANKGYEESLREQHRYREANRVIKKDNLRNAEIDDIILFRDLELSFYNHLKELKEETNKKLSTSTYKAYSNTFNKLKEYFQGRDLKTIQEKDFKDFKNHLYHTLKLAESTVNTHIIYLSKFLEYAVSKELLINNLAKKIPSLEENKKSYELLTEKEVSDLISFEYEDSTFNSIFKILAYSGLRISELYNLTNDSLSIEKDIPIIKIFYGKTKSSIRLIPISKHILKEIQSLDFPISNKSSNAFQKQVLKNFYKVIEKGQNKVVHSIRKSFTEQCLKHPSKVEFVQEILGHTLGDKELTIKIYGGGLDLKVKKEIIDSFDFQKL